MQNKLLVRVIAQYVSAESGQLKVRHENETIRAPVVCLPLELAVLQFYRAFA